MQDEVGVTDFYTINYWQQNQKMPTKAPLHPWEWATAPWQRMYIDYAGSFENSMFIVVVDAHSKWPEVIPVSSNTSSSNIERSHAIYSPDSEFPNRSLVTMVRNLFLRSSRRSSGPVASAI